MADPIREQIVQALLTRLKTIVTGNDYNTDIGLNVFRALRRPLEAHELPAIYLLEGDESESEINFGFDRYNFGISIQARVTFDDGDDWMRIGTLMIADVIKCLGVDQTLGGLALDIRMTSNQVGEAEEKVRAVGADISVEIDYRTQHLNPYA